uniref:Ras association domain family member 3 n=1 Tax=Astyanax mexicanus TaxID=7994 RepID=A0A8B9KN69_ASTMX
FFSPITPPLSLLFLNKYPNSLVRDGSGPGWGSPAPKPGLRAKVKGQRKAHSPRPQDSAEGEKEAAPRARKKSYKPPDVRTIFEARTKDPRVKEEKGEGHTFLNCTLLEWCDVCFKHIIQDGLVCAGEIFDTYTQLHSLITHSPVSSLQYLVLIGTHRTYILRSMFTIFTSTIYNELRTHLSYEEIRQKVELYNSASRDHLKMTLNADGLYTGFIKVQLELRRPITVTGGGGGGQEAFYLPRGCVNTLHISSSNTVRQVIEALLRKFTVADNPAKFALYKRSRREDHGEWNSDNNHSLFLFCLMHLCNFSTYFLHTFIYADYTADYKAHCQ